MTHNYSFLRWALPASLLLIPGVGALAQAPVVSGMIPGDNTHTAARTGAVSVTFSQPLTAASTGALQVFSRQRGGRRTTAVPATVSGNTLSFAPADYPFMPGETVQYTITRAAASSGGQLVQPRVGQFTTAVGSTGYGNFVPGSEVSVARHPTGVAVGDLDGDGDLDLVAANASSNLVSVRLNDGRGRFSGTQTVPMGVYSRRVALGDVDNDGDLDLLTVNQGDNTVSIRLNNGNASFGGGQDFNLGINPYAYPTALTLADVEGDGDLDLLIANTGGGVAVRVNNGSGTFTGSQNVPTGVNPCSVVAGDVDGDGDLDILAANNTTSMPSLSVRLNDGTGQFSGGFNCPVGSEPYQLVAGDLDGDGDLDVATCNGGPGTVSVRLNDGTGVYSAHQDFALNGIASYSLALGDVNADGALDLLVANNFSQSVSQCLNNGQGTFIEIGRVPVGDSPEGVVLADVDGDSDLDLIAATLSPNAISVRLNDGTLLSAMAGAARGRGQLYPNPARAQATLRLPAGLPATQLTLLDALGRPVRRQALPAGIPTAELDLRGLAPGLYLVRVPAGGQTLSQRLVVE